MSAHWPVKWQEHCSVPLKSFQLELVAAEFLAQSPWRIYDLFWFDWISRDFFQYLYWKAKQIDYRPGEPRSYLPRR